jgi:hypothetical protein
MDLVKFDLGLCSERKLRNSNQRLSRLILSIKPYLGLFFIFKIFKGTRFYLKEDHRHPDLGQGIGDLIHVLGDSGHKRLLQYLFLPAEPAKAKPVELFGVRETPV